VLVVVDNIKLSNALTDKLMTKKKTVTKGENKDILAIPIVY
jgi:hypothetical protein